ncbi:hypothetical protein ACHAXT_006330 [Thalassiosira profunda]
MLHTTTTHANIIGRIRVGVPFLESMKSNGIDELKELLGNVELSEDKIHDVKSNGGGAYAKLSRKSMGIIIAVSNLDTGTSTNCNVYSDSTLGWWIKTYTFRRISYHSVQGGPKLAPATRYFRIVHKGKTIFVSSSGKKTFQQLGIKSGDAITVGGVDSGERASLGDLSNATAPKKESSMRSKPNKKSHGGKKKNRKKTTPFVLTEDEIVEKQREIHSIAMTRVFEEMSPRLKDIRNRLNDLTIHKSAPKARKPSSRLQSQPQDAAVSLPMVDAASGKAGKVAYPILVGEVSCLYKTNKLSVKRATVLDLHGLSKDEALAKLNERLPIWVDTAMRGEHPWVIPVDIVCGGGSQILSDVVRGWIRSTRQVANRPKN